MQINMQDTGTFLFISDHCHVIENVGVSLQPSCQRCAYLEQRQRSSYPTHHDHSSLRVHANISFQWRDGIPQGWLARDHPAWFRSTQRLKHLERITRGQVIPGHDKESFMNLISKGAAYT